MTSASDEILNLNVHQFVSAIDNIYKQSTSVTPVASAVPVVAIRVITAVATVVTAIKKMILTIVAAATVPWEGPCRRYNRHGHDVAATLEDHGRDNFLVALHKLRTCM